jgi:hypothetical protein
MQAEEKHVRQLGRGGESPSSLEARAGAFLGEARATVGLTDAEIGAIEGRLVHRRRARRRMRLWPVLAALTLLLVAGSVMALVGGWRPRLPFVRSTPETGMPTSSRSAKPRTSSKTAGATELDTVTTEPSGAESMATAAPAPVPAPHALPLGRRWARQEPAPPAAAPLTTVRARPPAEGALSVEARSLADALARWRRAGDAETALGLLDAHDRRFPRGALSVESKVARAEILLALARRDQALVVLDSLDLASLPRARELETIRGELRVQAGRCRDARADLDRVLQDTAMDDFGRRASHAMAKCP